MFYHPWTTHFGHNSTYIRFNHAAFLAVLWAIHWHANIQSLCTNAYELVRFCIQSIKCLSRNKWFVMLKLQISTWNWRINVIVLSIVQCFHWKYRNVVTVVQKFLLCNNKDKPFTEYCIINDAETISFNEY